MGLYLVAILKYFPCNEHVNVFFHIFSSILFIYRFEALIHTIIFFRLLPFGAGRRGCPGEVLAKNRLFLIMSSIVQNFTIKPKSEAERPDHDPRTYVPGLPIHPKDYEICAISRTVNHSWSTWSVDITVDFLVEGRLTTNSWLRYRGIKIWVLWWWDPPPQKNLLNHC